MLPKGHGLRKDPCTVTRLREKPQAHQFSPPLAGLVQPIHESIWELTGQSAQADRELKTAYLVTCEIHYPMVAGRPFSGTCVASTKRIDVVGIFPKNKHSRASRGITDLLVSKRPLSPRETPGTIRQTTACRVQ